MNGNIDSFLMTSPYTCTDTAITHIPLGAYSIGKFDTIPPSIRCIFSYSNGANTPGILILERIASIIFHSRNTTSSPVSRLVAMIVSGIFV
jgi:hypothetical protein